MNKKILPVLSVLMLFVLFFTLRGALTPSRARAAGGTDVWWPKDGVRVQGLQPFKAMVEGISIEQYEMYWQVDGGTLTWMQNNYQDYPHKEASVDLSGWHWRGAGPYTITFVAKQHGTIISQQSVRITIPQPEQPSVQKQTVVLPAPTTAAPAVAQESGFYVNPNSSAAGQAAAWRSARPQDAAAMDVLAHTPTASWFGNWNNNVYQDVHSVVRAAAAQGTTPVLVAYDIPGRDCGSYSAGGSQSVSQYQSWIQSFAQGIGNDAAIVVLEPDALAQLTCLSDADQSARLSLLSFAIDALKANAHTKVYLDAGHAGWIDVNTMAARLKRANVGRADGFSLNVSNFDSTANSLSYGTQISALTDGAHFIVDTSRNGNGANGQWCNPTGRAIGQLPTTHTGTALVDAYLWVKTPGESDGWCNGGPGAGQWWSEYALTLVRNAGK
jgi:endoglucanase